MMITEKNNAKLTPLVLFFGSLWFFGCLVALWLLWLVAKLPLVALARGSKRRMMDVEDGVVKNIRKASIITFIFGVCFFSILWGEAMSQTIVDEIQLIRKKDRSAVLDIGTVASKYILIGSSKKEAVKQLKDEGFEIYEVSPKSNHDEEILTAIRSINLSPLTGFNDEIRIVLRIKNDLVVRVTGKLVFRSL